VPRAGLVVRKFVAVLKYEWLDYVAHSTDERSSTRFRIDVVSISRVCDRDAKIKVVSESAKNRAREASGH